MIFLNSQSPQAGTEMGCFACKTSGLCLHVLSGWNNWLFKVVKKMYMGFCGQQYNTPTLHLSDQRSSNSILCKLYRCKFVTYCILITSLLKQPLMSVGMHIL